jgi:hypothetical protein
VKGGHELHLKGALAVAARAAGDPRGVELAEGGKRTRISGGGEMSSGDRGWVAGLRRGVGEEEGVKFRGRRIGEGGSAEVVSEKREIRQLPNCKSSNGREIEETGSKLT